MILIFLRVNYELEFVLEYVMAGYKEFSCVFCSVRRNDYSLKITLSLAMNFLAFSNISSTLLSV